MFLRKRMDLCYLNNSLFILVCGRHTVGAQGIFTDEMSVTVRAVVGVLVTML